MTEEKKIFAKGNIIEKKFIGKRALCSTLQANWINQVSF
jgi:hypothetical protein